VGSGTSAPGWDREGGWVRAGREVFVLGMLKLFKIFQQQLGCIQTPAPLDEPRDFAKEAQSTLENHK